MHAKLEVQQAKIAWAFRASMIAPFCLVTADGEFQPVHGLKHGRQPAQEFYEQGNQAITKVPSFLNPSLPAITKEEVKAVLQRQKVLDDEQLPVLDEELLSVLDHELPPELENDDELLLVLDDQLTSLFWRRSATVSTLLLDNELLSVLDELLV